MIETKTIKEVAESVNISKTSVYNLIKKHSIQTFKKEGITYLDENAVSIILAYYTSEKHKTLNDIISDTKDETDTDIQGEFQDSKHVENTHLISVLERELEKSNGIIQGLLQSNQTLAETLKASEQRQGVKLLTDAQHNVVDEPQGFFKRMFRKK